MKEISKEKESLTHKQKEKVLRSISSHYIRNLQALVKGNSTLLNKVSLSDSCLPKINVSTDFSNELDNESKMVLCVNLSLNTLSDIEANIIYNDFIFPKGKKWWANYYSASSYYRNRINAINHFFKVYLQW